MILSSFILPNYLLSRDLKFRTYLNFNLWIKEGNEKYSISQLGILEDDIFFLTYISFYLLMRANEINHFLARINNDFLEGLIRQR